jgi:hypothetical protein
MSCTCNQGWVHRSRGDSFVFFFRHYIDFREESRYSDDITGHPEHGDGFSSFSIYRADSRVGLSISQQLLQNAV